MAGLRNRGHVCMNLHDILMEFQIMEHDLEWKHISESSRRVWILFTVESEILSTLNSNSVRFRQHELPCGPDIFCFICATEPVSANIRVLCLSANEGSFNESASGCGSARAAYTCSPHHKCMGVQYTVRESTKLLV